MILITGYVDKIKNTQLSPVRACYVFCLQMYYLEFTIKYGTKQIVINSTDTTSTQKIKISIIEDDTSIRELYSTKLGLDGFSISTARNGIEGLELARSVHPDLLLLDLRMPGMSGDEMLQRVRAEEWGSNIRVIILTNISKSEAPSILQFLSVDRYIVKAHYTPSQVVQVVKEVLHIA